MEYGGLRGNPAQHGRGDRIGPEAGVIAAIAIPIFWQNTAPMPSGASRGGTRGRCNARTAGGGSPSNLTSAAFTSWGSTSTASSRWIGPRRAMRSWVAAGEDGYLKNILYPESGTKFGDANRGRGRRLRVPARQSHPQRKTRSGTPISAITCTGEFGAETGRIPA